MSNINNRAVVHNCASHLLRKCPTPGRRGVGQLGQCVAYELLTKQCALTQGCTYRKDGVPFCNSHESTMWASKK